MQSARCWLAVLLHGDVQIDRAKLMDEPLLYRELQGVCTLCPNRQECSLAPPCRRRVRHPQVRRVVAVLPKLRKLTTIGALQNCGKTPQYTRAMAFSHLRPVEDN
jgi:hypothetical protein